MSFTVAVILVVVGILIAVLAVLALRSPLGVGGPSVEFSMVLFTVLGIALTVAGTVHIANFESLS